MKNLYLIIFILFPFALEAQENTYEVSYDSTYYYSDGLPKLEKIWIENVSDLCFIFYKSEICSKTDFESFAKRSAKRIRDRDLELIIFFETVY